MKDISLIQDANTRDVHNETREVRVFQELTGKWHISDDNLPHLESRGTEYPTRSAAIKEAKSQGWKVINQ